MEDDLESWLARDYATAYCTACLVLRDAQEAQDAVQEAFLRMWRFRASVPDGDARTGKAFREAWEGFTSGVEALVAASGRALLVLMCLLVVLVVGRLGWRASRRRLV